METMRLWLAVGAGGALGAMARHGVGALSLRLFGPSFPWGTLIVNAVGGLLMGYAVAAVAARDPALRAFLVTGVLGGFTTFSAFAFDAVLLGRERSLILAAAYVAASVALAVGGVVLGLAAGRAAP